MFDLFNNNTVQALVIGCILMFIGWIAGTIRQGVHLTQKDTNGRTALTWFGYAIAIFSGLLLLYVVFGVYHALNSNSRLGKDVVITEWTPMEVEPIKDSVRLNFKYNFSLNYNIYDLALRNTLQQQVNRHDEPNYLIKQRLIDADYYSFLDDVEVTFTFSDRQGKPILLKTVALGDLNSEEKFTYDSDMNLLRIFYSSNIRDSIANSSYEGTIQNFQELSGSVLTVSIKVFSTQISELEPYPDSLFNMSVNNINRDINFNNCKADTARGLKFSIIYNFHRDYLL